jgi:hypothetical protein
VWNKPAGGTDPHKLDIIHFETGTTALAELAWQIKADNSFFISSQDKIWNQYRLADYLLLLENNQLTPKALATAVANKYFNTQLGNQAGKTISVINLPMLSSFFNSDFDSFSQYLVGLINQNNKQCISQAHSDTATFHYDYVDLLEFINNVLQACPTPTSTEQAQAIGRLQSALNANNQLIVQANFTNVTSQGLSIYLPQANNSAGYYQYLNNSNLKFSRDFTWDEFLKVYLGEAEVSDDLPELPTVVGAKAPTWSSRVWQSIKQTFLSIFNR